MDLTSPITRRAASSVVARHSAELDTDVRTTRAQNAIARMRRGKTPKIVKKTIKSEHKLAVNKTVTKSGGQTKGSDKIAQQEKRRTFLCPVCFIDLQNNDVNVSATSCGHIFCTECISETLNKYKRCPLCCKEEMLVDLRRIFFSHV